MVGAVELPSGAERHGDGRAVEHLLQLDLLGLAVLSLQFVPQLPKVRLPARRKETVTDTAATSPTTGTPAVTTFTAATTDTTTYYPVTVCVSLSLCVSVSPSVSVLDCIRDSLLCFQVSVFMFVSVFVSVCLCL